MRYVNEKTGAIIDSPFKVSGANWKQVKESKKKGSEAAATKDEKEPDGE